MNFVQVLIEKYLSVPILSSVGKGRYFLFMLFLFIGACVPATEDFYARMPARLRVQYVQTIPPLNAALNSMGEFATIRQRNASVLIYSNLKTSVQRPMTAVDEKNYCLGVSGLIVGLPNIPPLGATVSKVVCFDLVCPNCYEQAYNTREMQLRSGGRTKCMLCNREYDLNNQGYIIKGEAGKSLYRYRVNYQNQTLVVNN